LRLTSAEQYASEQERCAKAGAADVKKKAARAASLWRERQPITEDCPAGRYLRGARGFMGAFPPTLGFPGRHGGRIRLLR
jgi:hypothetical protein